MDSTIAGSMSVAVNWLTTVYVLWLTKAIVYLEMSIIKCNKKNSQGNYTIITFIKNIIISHSFLFQT